MGPGRLAANARTFVQGSPPSPQRETPAQPLQLAQAGGKGALLRERHHHSSFPFAALRFLFGSRERR